MKETVRYIVGYLLGFSVFIVLIPLGLYKLSQSDYLLEGRVLFYSDILRYVLSGVFCLVGAIFAIWSNIFLFMVGKGGPADAFGVSISPQTRKLVTVGPYRYCRNPMMFGAFSLYLSVVLYLNSILGLACLIFFLGLLIVLMKLSEEKRLLKDFGAEYTEYKKKVPMFFPGLRIKRR
ncbi:MAG TPA: isoprenylcysteine carboxylmethyltransferase family protein [Paludibacter sp.]|nr:isoprenylcysteine carboxylmethyltransferase family protein [Paludibacter sp.]